MVQGVKEVGMWINDHAKLQEMNDQVYDPHNGPKVTLPMAGISNQIASGPKSFTLVQLNGQLYPVPLVDPIQ